jgi:hypothetical protein
MNALDIPALMESVPHDDLDLIHFVIGHGILRKEMRLGNAAIASLILAPFS